MVIRGVWNLGKPYGKLASQRRQRHKPGSTGRLRAVAPALSRRLALLHFDSASANGVVYVIAGEKGQDFPLSPSRDNISLYAPRANDGRQLWYYLEDRTVVTWNSGQSRISAPLNPQIFQPLYADGWVYTYDRFGDVVALRAGDGAALWQRIVGDGVGGMNTPVVAP